MKANVWNVKLPGWSAPIRIEVHDTKLTITWPDNRPQLFVNEAVEFFRDFEQDMHEAIALANDGGGSVDG